MIVNVKDFSATANYHLLTQTIIPRPIAWVLTQNADGETYNLAPFSFFNAVSADPPILMFSCHPKVNTHEGVYDDSRVKDTVVNSLREGRLVIHLATEQHLQAVQDSAEALPYGESELLLSEELSLCDFEAADSDTDASASGTGIQRLRGLPIAFACRLLHSQTLGNAPQLLIFAEVESLYVDDNAVTQHGKRVHIDAAKVAPLARLGLNQFSQLGTVLRAN